jgi:hypothetical protein
MSFPTRFLIVSACAMFVVFLWMRLGGQSASRAYAVPELVFNEPSKIASKDGCDTYAFLDEEFHRHYYTRCPNSTVTHDQEWDENVRRGKFYELQHRSETTETESN